MIRPFGRAVAAIPPALANAMLAGVLFSLCLAPVKAMAEAPRLAAPIILVWLLMARWKRLFATPAAAIVAGILIFATSHGAPIGWSDFTPQPILVAPSFSLEAADQPGAAVVHRHDGEPEPARPRRAVGL